MIYKVKRRQNLEEVKQFKKFLQNYRFVLIIVILFVQANTIYHIFTRNLLNYSGRLDEWAFITISQSQHHRLLSQRKPCMFEKINTVSTMTTCPCRHSNPNLERTPDQQTSTVLTTLPDLIVSNSTTRHYLLTLTRGTIAQIASNIIVVRVSLQSQSMLKEFRYNNCSQFPTYEIITGTSS